MGNKMLEQTHNFSLIILFSKYTALDINTSCFAVNPWTYKTAITGSLWYWREVSNVIFRRVLELQAASFLSDFSADSAAMMISSEKT